VNGGNIETAQVIGHRAQITDLKSEIRISNIETNPNTSMTKIRKKEAQGRRHFV
jgi:hypothetical protein